MTDADRSAIELARSLLSGELSARLVSLELSKLGDCAAKASGLVHFLHHYLADEDIRASDEAYRLWQNDRLKQLICEAESV